MQVSKKFKNGNITKAENYAAAWRQIKKANDNGYYIEALSIQESIICDRLLNHLHKHYLLPLRNKQNWHHTLHELIKNARKESKDSRTKKLFDQLNSWRYKRNHAVHAIVRSDPGGPEISADIYFSEARLASSMGTRIAKDVDNWCRRDTTRIKRLKQKTTN